MCIYTRVGAVHAPLRRLICSRDCHIGPMLMHWHLHMHYTSSLSSQKCCYNSAQNEDEPSCNLQGPPHKSKRCTSGLFPMYVAYMIYTILGTCALIAALQTLQARPSERCAEAASSFQPLIAMQGSWLQCRHLCRTSCLRMLFRCFLFWLPTRAVDHAEQCRRTSTLCRSQQRRLLHACIIACYRAAHVSRHQCTCSQSLLG